MKDMRNNNISKGDVVIVINLECLDYKVGLVEEVKITDTVIVNGYEWDAEDCLVLPKEYLYKVSDN